MQIYSFSISNTSRCNFSYMTFYMFVWIFFWRWGGVGASCYVFWFWEAVRQGVWWIRRPRLHWRGDVTPTYETDKIWIGKGANLQFLHLKHKSMQLELHDINQFFVWIFFRGVLKLQRTLGGSATAVGKGGKWGFLTGQVSMYAAVMQAGVLTPSPPAVGSGEHCELPSGIYFGTAAEIEFSLPSPCDKF